MLSRPVWIWNWIWVVVCVCVLCQNCAIVILLHQVILLVYILLFKAWRFVTVCCDSFVFVLSNTILSCFFMLQCIKCDCSGCCCRSFFTKWYLSIIGRFWATQETLSLSFFIYVYFLSIKWWWSGSKGQSDWHSILAARSSAGR